MASSKTFRVVTLSVSTPYSFVTGTTATSTANSPDYKGCEVVFQNQSTGATNVWIFDSSTGSIAIGATSTLGAGGILVAQNGSYQLGKRHAPSAIQMTDWFVASTSSNTICVAQLVKAV
jgi:hypothetical protein